MRSSAALLLTLAARCVLAAALEVPVIVEEPAGVARRGEPVSGGIALPPGQFKPGAAFALVDGTIPLPVQVAPLVLGPKGFLRWILLDYQLDLEPNERRTLTLRAAGPAKPARQLRTVDGAQALIVDTGAIRFTVSKTKPFGLFDGVEAGGKPVVLGGAVSYVDAATDQRSPAAPPESVKLLYNGPLRVTLEVRGPFTGDDAGRLRYRTTVTAWAGRSDVLVRHTLINSREDRRVHTKVKSSAIELKPAQPADHAVVGIDDASVRVARVEGPCTLHQGLLPSMEKPGRLTKGEAEAVAENKTGNWIALGPVWVMDRFLATDPPRLLAVRADGTLVLDAAPRRFDGVKDGKRVRGQPFESDFRWLFDCTQLSSEYRIDFAAPAEPAALAARAKAAAARVWGFAPGSWYAQCDVLAVGPFGTLDDEKACHKLWGWTAGKEPVAKKDPTRFVAWEDNHYESEADSTEALILMFLRTGHRGWFDEAEAWARYHTDIQTWRTDGWTWKDGAVWFPTGGPLGNRPQRPAADSRGFVPPWHKQATVRDRSLWHICIAKECYCHFYGAGIVDWFCLTGDRDALDAAIDKCELKLDEFARARKFEPGKSGIASTRGFGRGFYVAVRTWMAVPENPVVQKVIDLCRDTYLQLPDTYLDERGVYAVVQNKPPSKRYLTPGIKDYMNDFDITVDAKGVFHGKDGGTWTWRDIGGTWMISYIDYAVDMLARHTGDEDLIDHAIATGQFTARFMMSPVAKQTWYYTALDIPIRGQMLDPWRYDGLDRSEHGEGPKHSGWYTRFFPDVCAIGYAWTGEKPLLDAARRFWSYGNRRGYRTTKLYPQHAYAYHRPPKDDSTLSTARLFYLATHPRKDSQPPAAVGDLAAELLGDGKARITFTAPADAGGGRAVRYQVKAATLPIAPYEDWLYARDSGKKRNWWKATNCKGEPTPSKPGTKESFVVTGVPTARPLYLAVRTFDDSSNRSAMSNLATVK